MRGGGEIGTPVADCSARDLDIHHGMQNQSDITKRIFVRVEHGQGYEDNMDRIAHPLEIRLSKELVHGWELKWQQALVRTRNVRISGKRSDCSALCHDADKVAQPQTGQEG